MRRITVAILISLAALALTRPRAARGTELYVSAEESGEIVVVDADRGEVAARIPVGKRPRGIKLSHDGKLLYVALSGSPRAADPASTSRSCRPPIAPPTASASSTSPPQAVAHAAERPGPGVVRPLARRQDALRLERGDRRDERARPGAAARSRARSRSAASRRASPSAPTARPCTSPPRRTTRWSPSTPRS